jgi:hypothetical protein
VDDAAKAITFTGIRLKDVTPCVGYNQMVRVQALPAEFTPGNSGTYVVTVQPLDDSFNGSFSPASGQGSPVASTTVQVTE